nr:MAG TPA: hypothetical protein [Caudoviricetes sp.]
MKEGGRAELNRPSVGEEDAETHAPGRTPGGLLGLMLFGAGVGGVELIQGRGGLAYPSLGRQEDAISSFGKRERGRDVRDSV